jgi:serine/threonine-protein kinase
VSDLETMQATLAPHAMTLTRAPGATIRPRRPSETDAGRRLGALLDRLEGGEPLTLEDELGRGGMGVVRLATQRTLGRKVAVKLLRPGPVDEPDALRLLQEAWVTGAVEHPNIVPIHDVALGEGGGPLVVFKRIEGRPWSALLQDAALVPSEDPLEWHLRTLMQVCAAVAYAHSRGILHRDLKPDNVMVGEYGEVYVVDWGIAVSLGDDGSGRLPLAADATDLAGTPAYMAPEMMGGGGTSLGPHTDVYLLGGLLHAILTGRPPHRGATPIELALDALNADRELPPEAPAELASLCRRALSPDPAGRPASAEAFRQALQSFLDHRHSERLAARAEARLATLPAALAADPLAGYRLFGECRFGFRQALESWPGNAAAARGLLRATTALVDHELAAGHPEAAAALLAELDDPPAELAERVDRAREAALVERRRLEDLQRLARDLDSRIGRRTRVVLAVIMASLWMLMPTWRLMTGAPWAGYDARLPWPLVFFAVAALVGWFGRRSLFANAFNRRVLATVLLVQVAQTALTIGSWRVGVPPAYDQALGLFMGFVASGVVAITLIPRLWPAAAAYLALFLTGTFVPEHQDVCTLIANSFFALTCGWIWRKPAQKGRATASHRKAM